MRAFSSIAVLVAALVLTTVRPADALTVRVPVEELVTQSSQVLRGMVIDVRAEWTEDRALIVTRVTLAVTETWSGKSVPGEEIVLTVEGGVVGETGVYVEGEPAFVGGEDVVLLLHTGERGDTRVTGAVQGKFTVAGSLVVGFDHQPSSFQNFRSNIREIIRGQ